MMSTPQSRPMAPTFPFPRDLATEPSQKLAELRHSKPVSTITLPSGYDALLVTRYDDVRQILSHPECSLAAAATDDAPPFVPFVRLCESLLSLDAPIHTAVRRLLTDSLTPRRVDALRPRIQALSDELADEMLRAGPPANLVTAFADPLSASTMAVLLGIGTDELNHLRKRFSELITIVGQSENEIQNAWKEMHAGIASTLDSKRANPRDDLLSEIVDRASSSRTVTESHLVGLLVTMLGAGVGTPIIQITHSVVTLLRHPTQWNLLLQHPALVHTALEELLRYNAPTEVDHVRIATGEIELAAATIPTGSAIFPSIASANRDQSKFANPDQLDITRTPNGHIAFGHGPHACAGSTLARAELRAALTSLISKIPGLTLAVPAVQLQLKSPTSHSVSLLELPVTWS